MPPEDEQERNLPGSRKDLQRCQYGVHHDTKGSTECKEPAVATWDWGRGPLYVCQRHDEEIDWNEMEARSRGATPPAADQYDDAAVALWNRVSDLYDPANRVPLRTIADALRAAAHAATAAERERVRGICRDEESQAKALRAAVDSDTVKNQAYGRAVAVTRILAALDATGEGNADAAAK